MAETERERLVKAICDSVRRYSPDQRIDAYFRMKQRLQETRIEVLREILEEDLVNVTASPSAVAAGQIARFVADCWRPGAREAIGR